MVPRTPPPPPPPENCIHLCAVLNGTVRQMTCTSTPLLIEIFSSVVFSRHWMRKCIQHLHAKDLGTKNEQSLLLNQAILWLSGQLGFHSAQALQNTIYFYSCKVFRLRSYDKYHDLQCKQFQKYADEFGYIYLVYNNQGYKQIAAVSST